MDPGTDFGTLCAISAGSVQGILAILAWVRIRSLVREAAWASFAGSNPELIRLARTFGLASFAGTVSDREALRAWRGAAQRSGVSLDEAVRQSGGTDLEGLLR